LKILIVTGLLGENLVKNNIKDSKHEIDVLVLPVSVASFITPEIVKKKLREKTIQKYDIILMPGSVEGDVTSLEETTNIPTFKGPIHAADLNLLLNNIEEIELSGITPANQLLTQITRENILNEIEKVEKNWQNILKKHGGFLIGSKNHGIPVGKGFPMRIIAEIVNAPLLELEKIERKARYYQSQGANIIDIGMLAGNPMPYKISQIIKTIRRVVDLPISIDTLEPYEIKTAVHEGIDLVLSIDSGNMELLYPILRDVPVVVLPSNIREGNLPRNAENRIKQLLSNIERANDLGIRKIIADPVLEPPITPGILEPLIAYHLFRKKDTATPVLFGLGNATELMDIDTQGTNGLLAALAHEVGAQLLHVPEHSTKAQGSVKEAQMASRMMFIAGKRATVPKDLGVNLLLLKEKSWREEPYTLEAEKGVKIIKAKGKKGYIQDDAGWFRIKLDRDQGEIIALHYPVSSDIPDIIIKGKCARDIYQTVIKKAFIKNLEHSAYLGRELMKAQIAIKIGRSYVQDEPLFYDN
jgi:dihydropteroate synthase-like protein